MTWIRNHGLTLVLLALFLASLVGQAWAGWLSAVDDLSRHGGAAPTAMSYIASGEFISAVFENWESEFLQMAAYVVLTAHLFQRGSAESRDPDGPGREGDAPRPGFRGWVHAHSLGLALAALFILSFAAHLFGSAEHATDEAVKHGAAAQSLWQHLAGPQFWFESFQNWQSEFLSTAVLVVFSIFLREHGSPESKPLSASNAETGG